MYFALQFLPDPYYWAGILLSGTYIMSLLLDAIANDPNLWNLSPHTIGRFVLYLEPCVRASSTRHIN